MRLDRKETLNYCASIIILASVDERKAHHAIRCVNSKIARLFEIIEQQDLLIRAIKNVEANNA